jgi:hypothetical protein
MRIQRFATCQKFKFVNITELQIENNFHACIEHFSVILKFSM